MRKSKLKIGIAIVFSVTIFTAAFPQLFHKNKGESTSEGDYNNGSMKNGFLLPWKGENFKCYSWFSYYILDREYTNSSVYYAVMDSYKELASNYPNRKFIYMESAKRKGGRLYPHRTHQNGLSIDFFSPLINEKGKPKYFDFYGIFRYLLNFDENGNLTSNAKIAIDFNCMADHILLLDKHARNNGLRIKKVIFNIDLKDNLFQTEQGKKLKKSGIYLAQNLTPLLNKLHDDHYHVDFELVKK